MMAVDVLDKEVTFELQQGLELQQTRELTAMVSQCDHRNQAIKEQIYKGTMC